MMRLVQFILVIFFCLGMSFSYAAEPQPVEQAFALSAFLNQDKQLIIEWNIAPGYFLYRNEMRFISQEIGTVNLPPGEMKQDALHGKYQAYTGKISVIVPVKNNLLNLEIHYQGCSENNFCYAPITKYLNVDLKNMSAPQDLTHYIHATPRVNSDTFFNAQSNIIVTLLSFLGLGLLLAFTPCVLPMVPILSAIIVGQNKKNDKARAFFLSLIYVLGMAITYAIAGLVIALIGSNIQTELQRPWVIVLFSGLFVLLALSLFGFYELQLPRRLQQQINKLSGKQKGGTYIGAFLMGCLSTLIVSPCVSAPLVGVLSYIGHSGNVLLGTTALFALGLGMGIPLLLLGLSFDKLLPKAGHWMIVVERLFGVVMLGIAIWMLSRMIPGPVTLFLWSLLFVGCAIFFELFFVLPGAKRWLTRAISFLLFFYGLILMIGVLLGNGDPLRPWENMSGFLTQKRSSPFVIVSSMQQLDQQLQQARATQKPVILDFYADWCVSCVSMDKKVFSRADVQKALSAFTVLRVDLTKSNAFTDAVTKRFHIVGPPTILFFNQDSQELTSQRIVGEVSAEEMMVHLTQ